MQNYLDTLNPDQKNAVLQTKGPVLILAGAGSGKTKTITHRILHLIKEGVNPSSVLAVTFTNKAAKEMRERIEKILSEDSEQRINLNNIEKPFISTFHSLGVYIIKENHREFGIPKHFSIFDRNDSKKAVKEGVIKAGLDPKQFEPGKILSIISNQKGSFVTLEKFKEQTGNEYFKQIIFKVWEHYEKTLSQEKALDFDDLLLKTALLLRDNEKVRNYYKNKWQYIHIDEYQDTNKVQYEISRLLVGENQNICVVGDDDQCLLPSTKILTKSGEKRIDQIKKDDEIISASGHGDVCFSNILNIKEKKYKGNIVKIKTKKGFVLEATPEHIMFSKFNLDSDIYYTYLMYRKDKGFRIGIVKGKRKTGRPDGGIEEHIGFVVRNNQEKADKMWVLRVCKDRQEASFWEYYYSSKYGIPLLVFFDNERKISMNQKQIDKLFQEIDTEKRAQKIFKDLNLYFEYPHYSPQGTTRINTEKQRTNIRLAMFDDKRKSLSKPWNASRISINTTDKKLKTLLEESGFKTRKGKNNDWRFEVLKIHYEEVEEIAQKILSLDKNLIIKKNICLNKEKRFAFLPAGSLHPTMKIAFYKNNKIEEDEIVSVEKEKYDGLVYDLDIKNTHNYIANNIIVHNCIYSWRGANHVNIINFEKDYKNTKVITLGQNYRSTKNILSAAGDVIKKNKIRKEKNFFTQNEEGEKISLIPSYTEIQEARAVAQEAKKIINKGVSPNEIAVLYRANFQSRALEESFLTEGVPYQVLGTKFFDRKEIKDIISYLKASLNNDSITDIKRIINFPVRGIGNLTILKLFSGKKDELNKKTQEKIENFYNILEKIKEKALNEKPSDTIKFIIQITGIEEKLKKGNEEDFERLANIGEFVTLATKYDYLTTPEGVEKLLEDAALATDQDELDKKEQKNAVKLMTVHASKGLEFEYVFVTGLEDKLFPSKREEKQTENQKEEERRLFYVAITRAKKKLYLTYASVRMIFGSKQMNPPSEFIFDISDDLIQEETAAIGELNGIKRDSKEKIIYLDF